MTRYPAPGISLNITRYQVPVTRPRAPKWDWTCVHSCPPSHPYPQGSTAAISSAQVTSSKQHCTWGARRTHSPKGVSLGLRGGAYLRTGKPSRRSHGFCDRVRRRSGIFRGRRPNFFSGSVFGGFNEKIRVADRGHGEMQDRSSSCIPYSEIRKFSDSERRENCCSLKAFYRNSSGEVAIVLEYKHGAAVYRTIPSRITLELENTVTSLADCFSVIARDEDEEVPA